jgi:hypothetical protein
MTLSFFASAAEGRRRLVISAALIIALKNFERIFMNISGYASFRPFASAAHVQQTPLEGMRAMSTESEL